MSYPPCLRLTSALILMAICGACRDAAQETPQPTTVTSQAPAVPADPVTHRLYTAHAVDQLGQEPRLLVDEGDPPTAAAYNAQIEADLGVPVAETLDGVLAFAGFTGVTSRELELATPKELAQTFGSEVASVRFFAPKIIDVSKPGKDLGWRKVVRLRVRANAPAAARNVSAMFLLFNVFQSQKETGQDPFEPCRTVAARCSQNNQVILTIKAPAAGRPTAYWLVFEAATGGGRRTDHLNATFDGGDQASTTSGNAVKAYYVPNACAQCHGGGQESAKLNLLDTDHWNDRIQSGDDFAAVKVAGQGVLFDGKTDSTAPVFHEVFDTLKALNTEIRDQIASAGGEDFQLRAADGWLTLHKNSREFARQVDRALPPLNPTDKVWKDVPADVAALALLNRYCYRCHSNVAYHVFDKQAVLRKRARMITKVKDGPLKPFGMPQDRVLDTAVVDDIVATLAAIQ